MKTSQASTLIFSLLCILSYTGYGQNSTLIEDHFKALSDHNIKNIVNGYADNAEMYSPNWEGANAGTADITKVYTRYFNSTPDISYKVTHVINAGDIVVVEYVYSGTLSNPEENTPSYMKDKKYTLNCCAIFTLKNGKIIKETDYFDQVSFLKQVGFFDPK